MQRITKQNIRLPSVLDRDYFSIIFPILMVLVPFLTNQKETSLTLELESLITVGVP